MTSAMLAGCDDSSSSLGSLTDAIDDGGTTAQADISPDVLDSAASFLGAATGKEIPLSVDSVIFINSALGLNDVPNDSQNLFGDLWMIARDAYVVPTAEQNAWAAMTTLAARSKPSLSKPRIPATSSSSSTR